MNTKDEMIKDVKQWYSNIADLRAKHKLVIVMWGNGGENKYTEIKEFFESQAVGVKNYFSNGRMARLNQPSMRLC